jgi:hypothetical protein
MRRLGNNEEAKKASRERQIFEEFAKVANAESNLQVDMASIKNEGPPEPDISCTINGNRHCFEMVEITDEDLACNVSISIKEMKITGGAFSQDIPLIKAFVSKARKSYPSFIGPLELLAYYDKQYPAPRGGIQQTTLLQLDQIIKYMANNLNWNRFWVYDTWNTQILGVHAKS